MAAAGCVDDVIANLAEQEIDFQAWLGQVGQQGCGVWRVAAFTIVG